MTYTKKTLVMGPVAPLLVALLFLCSAAQAGPGFFITTYGGRYFGLGGTHIALGGSVMDLQANPAMLIMLPNGRFEMGGPVIFGRLQYVDDFSSLDRINPGLSFTNDVDSRTIAFIPYMAYGAPVSEHFAWGIAAYAQAGGGVDITDVTSLLPIEGTPGEDSPIPLRFERTVQDQFQGAYFLKVTPGFAFSWSRLSVGLGLDVVYGNQVFDQTFFDEQTGDEVLKLEYESDHVITLGGKVGVTLAITDNLRLAYAYMLRNEFDFDGSFTQTDQGVVEDAQVQNQFTIPDRHTVGLAYKVGKLTFAADANLVRYASFFKKRHLVLDEPLFPGGATVSKATINYKDQLFYSAGLEYQPKNVAYRIGWHYGKSPIRELTVSPVDNLIAEHHGQVGVAFNAGRFTYNAALEVAFASSYRGTNSTEWGRQRFFSRSDTYKVTMSQVIPYFSVGYNF